jgi:hypothetical protein
MTYGENGSVIGPQNLSTTSAAPGVWSLGEIAESVRDGIWPKPFKGFIAQFESGFPSQTVLYTGGVDLDSNDDLFISFRSYGNPSSASVYSAGFAKINTTTNTLTDTRLFQVGAATNYTALSNLTVDSAGSDDIILSGDTDAGSGYSVYTVKLNSSYVEQWFGINSSDQLWRRTSGQNTYVNYPASHRMSPNGTHLYAGGYGYAGSGYDPLVVPASPSTGYRIGNNNLTDVSNPSGMGLYLRCQALNNSNYAWMTFPYHSSYGGYHNHVLKVYNGGSSASATGLRIDFGGGSFSGGTYMNAADNGDLYNTAGNADRYPYMGIIQGGTGNGTAYFFRWNHATGWNTFDQGYRFVVNAADSPASPTVMASLYGITFSADDSTCYATFSDNGGTPQQQYLVSFDPGTSSTTVNWQRKILVYKTGDSMPGSQQNCTFTNMKLDSTGENIYFAGHVSSSGNAQNKLLVFKLPTDGSGEGTYTVGDFTVVYGTSNMTGTQGDLVGSTTGNTYSMFSPYENGTATRTGSAETGTLTVGS